MAKIVSQALCRCQQDRRQQSAANCQRIGYVKYECLSLFYWTNCKKYQGSCNYTLKLSIINTEPSNLYKLSANKRMKNSQPLPSLHQHSDVQMLQREQAKKWATVSLTLLARAGLQAEQSSSSR